MKGTMVGRDQLEVVLQQTLPKLVMVRWRSQRRGADIFGAFETGAPQVLEAEGEGLRAGLGKGGGAVVAGLAHPGERPFGAEGHEVDRPPGPPGGRGGPAGGPPP